MTTSNQEIYTPALRILSNGRLTSFLSETGTGGSQVEDLTLTRWSIDPGEDKNGYFIYLRDIDSGEMWSVTRQPVWKKNADYSFGFEAGLVFYRCSYNGIDASLEVSVASEDDLEIRKLSLRNTGSRTRSRRIEVTSYLEVVLNSAEAEISHPAFSKLFVQTEFDSEKLFVAAHRRPRGKNEPGLWMVHGVKGGLGVTVETDRKRFLGRGGNASKPLAMQTPGDLSGTVGNVLDPVFSLRTVIELVPDGADEVLFYLSAHTDKEAAFKLMMSAQVGINENKFGLKGFASEINLLNDLNMSAELAMYADMLTSAMLYRHPGLRAEEAVLSRSAGDAKAILRRLGLASYGFLAVVRDSGSEELRWQDLRIISQYLRAKGLTLTVLYLYDHQTSETGLDGIVIYKANDLSVQEQDCLLAYADLVVHHSLPMVSALRPSLPLELNMRNQLKQFHSITVPSMGARILKCFNGHGGFSEDGKEYVIRVDGKQARHLALPPLPWTNVIANEQFGFIVSESGASCTWSRNSREHRLTPWFNDPVSDPHGEAIYLRDNDNQAVWSPTPGPVANGADIEISHGFGYSRFEQTSYDIEQRTIMFVPRHDPIKIVKIALSNTSAKQRSLSVFNIQRLVMGSHTIADARHIVTEFDAGSKTMLAHNRSTGVFSDGVAFASYFCTQPVTSTYSGNRQNFIGNYGSMDNPKALQEQTLDGITGAGMEPCFAQQLDIEIAPSTTCEIYFLFGEATSNDEAIELVHRYQSLTNINQAYTQITGFWSDMTSAVEVQSPSPAIDLMLNGWLVYQNLCCRIWGRSAFYQSGGAYGFRDQLQDSSAMIYANPTLTRNQICLHAGHQFIEGDVLHWWHPAPLERGMRTRFADDLLWLPYITAFYINTTGDASVLDEVRPFLTASQLVDGEDEMMQSPDVAAQSANIYFHCCLALDRSLTTGEHGLPLMGSGDWNDGMNRVGRLGKGESVWMGFFLYRILKDFIPFCILQGDIQRADRYQTHLNNLHTALNEGGWDGDWYRRAYYDNGAVLGSKESDECQIDALAQAWSVISGAASPERAKQALDAVEQRLIFDKDKLIRLLAPSFVNTPHDPGYIKGYVAGVRENGGQYTHAACWVVRAMAEMGRRDRALQLLENLSPVSHAMTPDAVARYQVEPYVIAADIYGEEPHIGRGGWTWYTGSAGWMFRVALESVFGVRVIDGNTLQFQPSMPKEWPGFRLRYRLPNHQTSYLLEVKRCALGQSAVVTFDGNITTMNNGVIELPILNDSQAHHLLVLMA